MKTSKLAWKVLVFASLASCGPPNETTTTQATPPTEAAAPVSFDEYVASFPDLQLPFEVDSEKMVQLHKSNPFPQLSKEEYKFFNPAGYGDTCWVDDGERMYVAKKAGRIQSVHTTLLYYVTINEKCPLDVYAAYFVACSYDRSGNLRSTKEIGKYFAEMWEVEYRFFELRRAENNSLWVTTRNIEVDYHEFEENGHYREETTEEFYLE